MHSQGGAESPVLKILQGYRTDCKSIGMPGLSVLRDLQVPHCACLQHHVPRPSNAARLLSFSMFLTQAMGVSQPFHCRQQSLNTSRKYLQECSEGSWEGAMSYRTPPNISKGYRKD